MRLRKLSPVTLCLCGESSLPHRKDTMQQNKVKQTLAEGGIALGTMIFEFRTPGIAHIAASAGAEFAIIDMEHTGWSDETVSMLVATARGSDLLPFVRVPATQYHLMSRP